jgi:glucosylceramidase
LPPSSVGSYKWTPGVSPSYQLVNRASARCVDAAGWGAINGTAVDQWACGAGQQNQEWQLRPAGGSYYGILNRNAAAQNLVLDVAGGAGATANGAKVQLWTSSGATNQQWKPVPLGGGFYELVARSSGKCLDVPGASTANGVQLQQWSCTGASNQQFAFAPQP